MRRIQLNRIKNEDSKMFALVDDVDFDELNKFNWYITSDGYAARNIKENGIKRLVLMHRQILNTTSIIDHIDGVGINNQKVNLRPCTYSQNMLNSRKRKGCSSKFKGVSIDKHQGYVCYKTRVHINGRQIAQKRFPYTPEGEMMAAEFYNTQAKIHFGQFANLNKIQR